MIFLSIGANIRDLRLKNKKTIKELAEFLKITEQAVSQYEREIRTPNYHTLELIAKYFNVQIMDLFPNDTVKQTIHGVESLLKTLDNKLEKNNSISWNDIKGLTIEELIEVINFLDSLSDKIISKRLSKRMNEDDIVIKKITFANTERSVVEFSINSKTNELDAKYFYGKSSLNKKVKEVWENEGIYGAINIDIKDHLE